MKDGPYIILISLQTWINRNPHVSEMRTGDECWELYGFILNVSPPLHKRDDFN